MKPSMLETSSRINFGEMVPASLRVFLATALLSSGCIPWKPWSPWDSQHPRNDLCRFVDYQGGVKAMECQGESFYLEVWTYSSGTKEVRIDSAVKNSGLRGKVGRLNDGTLYSEQYLSLNGEKVVDSQWLRRP